MAFLIGGYVIALVSDISSVAVPLIGEVRPWQLTFFIVGLPGVLIAPGFYTHSQGPGEKKPAKGQRR